ncbi:hypothetical protein CHH83_05990 [Bacillus sp. 7586-K]|nr:hypothetical protein CHH83_05990 [Bacillus sp. 7586-K]
MSVANKYLIERKYIQKGKARSGTKLTKGKPTFCVSHETANNNADAMAHFKYFNNQQPSASAHTFIDATRILEIVPLDEKAWHVRYNQDRKVLGKGAANDNAIGIELCRTGNFKDAYDRYVWYHAYLCRKYGWNPKEDIVSHKTLDPTRRSDPDSWLNPNGVTWAQFISDVKKYYDAWDGEVTVEAPKTEVKTEVVKTPSKPKPTYTGNSFIKKFQDWLNKTYKFNLVVDGIYGLKTKKAALMALQTELNKQFGAGLNVDGIWGPKTKAAIRTVSRGAKGNITGIIQGMLYCLGFDLKGFDGVFGNGTLNAVMAFQKKMGLTEDGKVGRSTFKVLFN